jgi:hypothetical protein
MSLAKSQSYSKNNKLPTVFYFQGNTPNLLYRQVGDWLQTSRAYPFRQLSRGLDFFTSDDPPSNALLIFHLSTPEDLVRLDEFFQELCARDWNWTVQLIAITNLDHPKVFEFLQRRNCEVILQSVTTLKTAKGRIDRKLQLLELSDRKEVPEFLAQLAKRNKDQPRFKMNWTDSLLVSLDYWLIPNERFIYQADGEWIITLLGPRLKSGVWQNVEDKTERTLLGQGAWWKWVPKSNGSASSGEVWFFRGNQPKHACNRWNFTGREAELVVVNSKKKKFPKFRVINGQEIEVAPNSSYSIQLLPRPTDGDAPTDSGQSKTKAQSGGSVFQRIDDASIIRQFIDHARDSKCSVILWKKKNKLRLSGNIVSVQSSIAAMEFTVSKSVQRPKELLNLLSGAEGSFLGTFNTQKGCIFFHSKRVETNTSDSNFVIFPEKIFFCVQRRESLRISLNDPASQIAQYNRSALRVINLSSKGICLFRPVKDLAQSYPQKMENLILNLGGHQVTCGAELRWVKPSRDPRLPGIQAGYRFTGLSEEDACLVQLFIFEQTED